MIRRYIFASVAIAVGLAGAVALAQLGGGGFRGRGGAILGPTSSTDNAIARFDGTTGKRLQNSGVTIDDDDSIIAIAGTGPILSYTFSGDTNTGIFNASDGQIQFVTNGTIRAQIINGELSGNNAAAWSLSNSSVTSTNPSVRSNGRQDSDSGAGWAGADQPNIIAGGVEGFRIEEASSQIILKYSVHAGLTAGTTQTQADGLALLSSYNEVATVANTNDTVVLPTADAGRKVTIMNNGANTMRIFPASGDDLGAGADTATTLASGSNVTYFAFDATNWESI